MQKKKAVRKNGFQLPLNWLQVLGWFLAIFEICFISVFILTDETLIPCLFMYSLKLVLIAVMVLLYYMDPTAQKIIDDESDKVMCSICGWDVGIKAKHCGQCNRCTGGFDHHCKWLNNCIGDKNYRVFIGLVVVLNIDKLLMMFYILMSLVTSYGNKDFGFFAAQVLLGVENFSVLGFTLNLLVFHIYLKCAGITTYQYLLRRREKSNMSKDNLMLKRKKEANTVVKNSYSNDSIKNSL